jgi:hypothetical protein
MLLAAVIELFSQQSLYNMNVKTQKLALS